MEQAQREHPARQIQAWEYVEVYVDVNNSAWRDSRGNVGDLRARHYRFAPDELLDELGADGWELVGVVPIGAGGHSYGMFLKRPRRPSSGQITGIDARRPARQARPRPGAAPP